MAEFPSLPIFTDAFISDTTHLSAAETGAYMMLLMCAWRRPNCDLPTDDKTLAKWARCTPAQWKRVKQNVLSFWHEEDGFLKQKRLSNVRKTVSLKVHLTKLAGQASALKRKNTKSTDVGVPLQQPKPKPKPEDKKEDPPIVPPKGKTKKCKTLIPDDFELDDKKTEIALRHGIMDPLAEFEHFKNHHAGRGTLWVDWDRCWVTWCCTAKKYNGNGSARGSPVKMGRAERAAIAMAERERRKQENGRLDL